MSSNLQAEINYRAAKGWHPVTIKQFEETLGAIGYYRDKSMECFCQARVMTGDRAGAAYPCITTAPREIESGLRYSNASAKGGVRYERLKELRGEAFFAVYRGAILEI